MRNTDYIPSHDEDFDVLQSNVYTTASTKASQWLISSQVISELSPLRQRWATAFAAYRNPATRTPAVIQEKIDARKVYEAAFRTFVQGQLMHNPRVTDADLRSMGLPVHDRKPTKPQPPTTRPELEITFAQILQHIIRVRDSESKGSGKPDHTVGYELWRYVGDKPDPTYDDMQLVEQVSRLRHLVEYPAKDRGKNVSYAARWVNSAGKGPWSEIVSAIIP
jgi:hypothetical protein